MPERQRVLLIEDEPDAADLFRLALTASYEPDVARTAAEARRCLAGRRYDLVISDWRLPDGDGLEILNAAADAGMPTILMSGYLFQLVRPDQRHAYLMKPLRPSEFIQAVERILAAPAGS
jgi:DNA-binding NtrC family response regulator